MRIFLLFFALLLLQTIVSAQEFSWATAYDIEELNEVGAVSTASNGDVFIAGIHHAPTTVPYNGDVYIIKTDMDGNQIWVNHLQGLIRFGDMTSVDNGIVLTGQVTDAFIYQGLEYGFPGHAMFVLFINNEGALEWVFVDSSRFGIYSHVVAADDDGFVMSYRGAGNIGDYISLWDIEGNELMVKQIAQSGQIVKDIAYHNSRLFINGNLTTIGQVIEIDGLTIEPPSTDHGAFVLGFDQNMMASWVMVDTVINNADGQIAANANGVFAYVDLKRNGFNSEKKLMHFDVDGNLLAETIVPAFNSFSLIFPEMVVADNHIGMFVRNATGGNNFKLLVFDQELNLIDDPVIQGISSPYTGKITSTADDFLLSHIFSSNIYFGNDLVLPATDNTKRVYLAKYTNEVQVGFQTDVSPTHQVRFSPNPFVDFVQLQTSSGDEIMHQIQIFDVQGKMVHQTDVDARHFSLQLDHLNLNQGVYFFKVLMENDQLFTAKMIRY